MVRILPALVLALGTAAAVAGASSSTPQPASAWPEFQQFYRQSLTQHAIVGSSVALLRQGVVVERDHEGLRDRSANAPVDANTIFHWASITKTFTGIAVMRLRDEGRLKLDDPIVKYVPELRKISNPFGPVEQMTLRHLLSHSAGFRSGTWPWGTGDAWQPFEPPGWEQLVGMMPYTRIEFAPGSKYQYSNPGLVFLGRVIEDVTGEPFETYIDKEILRPLGMTHTFFDRAPSFLRGDRSHSYFVTDAGLAEAPFDFDSGITVANGGLNAPIDDMVKYLAFLTGSRDAAAARRYDGILKRTSLEEMWKPVVPVSDGVSMGLTFFLERRGGQDYIAHSGGQNGFISHFYLHPASGTSFIVAFNTQTTSEKDGDRRNTRALDAAVRDWLLTRVVR
jgi:CubicO group peptidase (beta-lactamase class C family)